jgi:uncharacterized phage-associated protein
MDVRQFAGWIARSYQYRKEPLTHLKVQKLAFYCYGAVLAHDLESRLSDWPIQFEAWEHGPVNKELWSEFKSFGGQPIASFPESGVAEPAVEDILQDALTVYGALSAWSLRQQSHLEQPWKDAFEQGRTAIHLADMRAHFKRKFAPGAVVAPEYLFGLGSFRIDGIPIQTYPSFKSLAAAVKRAFQDQTIK